MAAPPNPGIWVPHAGRCVGEGCNSGSDTWPLFLVSSRGECPRLCSSCVLLSHRSMYCCSCFFLLAPAPPAHYDTEDRFIASHAPTATCRVCREAVVHLTCLGPQLQSAAGDFVCPACTAAAEGRPFTYASFSCSTVMDQPTARIFVVAARIALALLRREAAEARANGERLLVEAAAAQKQAYMLLGLAHSVDPTVPSTLQSMPPPPELPENGPNGGMVLDLNEPNGPTVSDVNKPNRDLPDLNQPPPPPC